MDIVGLAKKYGYWSGQTVELNDVGLQAFTNAVLEEAAKVCDGKAHGYSATMAIVSARECAAAIRAMIKGE